MEAHSIPSKGLVTVYQGTSVEPVGSTLLKEVGPLCKDQIQHHTFTRAGCEDTKICVAWAIH
eukprot:6834261-Prorocentrum_lima.AAC.1